jgi:hypothetical protein
MVGGSSALGREKSGIPTAFRAEQGFAADAYSVRSCLASVFGRG